MMTLTTRIALSLATFGFVGLLGASPALAGQDGEGRRADRTDKAARMCAELACTDAQKAQIKSIKDAKVPQMKAARDNLRQLHAQIKAELRKPSPDARTIERLDAEMAAQKAAVQKQRRAGQLQILALLKPDQKAKLLDRMERRHGKQGAKGEGQGRGKRGGKFKGPQRAR